VLGGSDVEQKDSERIEDDLAYGGVEFWRTRNDRIFNNAWCEAEELVEDIKVLSWRWFLNRTCAAVCLFYERHWNPKECLLR